MYASVRKDRLLPKLSFIKRQRFIREAIYNPRKDIKSPGKANGAAGTTESVALTPKHQPEAKESTDT